MTLHIPDLSQHQGVVDLSKVGPVVILRAHNGYRADAAFKARQAQSRQYQRVRLFYGFCVPDRDAATQARELAAIVGPLQPGEGFACDMEQGAGNQTPRMLAYLNELGGVDIDYSGLSFAKDHLPGRPPRLLMWLAAYRDTEPTEKHFLWQHSDHEIHAGVSGPCDCSIFNGTVQQLRDLITPPIKTQAVIAPTPLHHHSKGKRMDLYRRHDGKDTATVYQAVGSHLESITSLAFKARGLSQLDVQVLPSTNPIWKLPVR